MELSRWPGAPGSAVCRQWATLPSALCAFRTPPTSVFCRLGLWGTEAVQTGSHQPLVQPLFSSVRREQTCTIPAAGAVC